MVEPSIVRLAWLVPAFPLLGAALILFFGKRLKRASGPIATLMMVSAFITSVMMFFQVIERPGEDRAFVVTLAQRFLSAGDLGIALDMRIDPLSLVMLLVVTGVGSLIHLYSIGYMKGDPREPRFFSYLNLFAFSMLVLVLANNFFFMFVGWELVGLCSYLLIGFWFERSDYASAAKKAFVTNRVGDFAFLIGIFMIFASFGTLDFGSVFDSAEGVLTAGVATAIALLLFGGATGKSAQIPLYVWLPDAMAGPTPVSALIHAATMVTAGVYMVARTHVIYDLSPIAGDVVAAVGIATVLLAGAIAIVQDDIKKVLAYSTVSQLGYMFVGVGVGAYASGVFHLVTHAFFKALLFLGAGSVMHAIANRTDITKMGGLARAIPWTMTTFLMGWLAIIGFPGTSGFFSKDQILEGAYAADSTIIWVLGLLGAVLTGFYMTRLVVLTFFGSSRSDDDVHPHESPVSMVFPLVVLGLASLLAGFMGTTPENGAFQRFIEPVVTPDHGEVHHEGGLSVQALSALATGAGLAGAAAAFVMYGTRVWGWQRRRENPSLVWRAARNKFFVDDVYQFLFTSVGRLGATALAFVVDARWIDGVVNGVGSVAVRLGNWGRKAQNGLVRSYALGLLGGTIVLVAFLIGRQGF